MFFRYSGQPSSDPDDVDYVPTIFSFTRPQSDTVVARQSRLEKRKAQKEREEEEKEKAEQERLEMELLEQEAVQALLAMNVPSSVATQTEKIPTTDSCQQTDKRIMTVKETQTQDCEGTSTCMAAQSARVPLNVISTRSLTNDDEKTKFYTGLPKWTLFEQLFSLLSSHITPSRTKLTL